MSNQPTHSDPTNSDLWRPGVADLPLIIEQLQDQLDQLRATVEAQQAVTERHEARLAALESR